MSDQNVHFEQPGYLTPGSSLDNGQETVQAVKPLANGEDADQTVFNRPVTNLFTRSEAIRGYLENSMYLEDADRSILLQGGGTITWTWGGSNGSFTTSADMFIKPFLSPAVAAFSSPTVGYIGWDPNDTGLAGSSLTTAIIITSVAAPTGACPTPPRVYNGANQITIIVVGIAAYGPPSVTTTVAIGPVPTQTITVTLDSTVSSNRYIATGNPNTGIVDALNGTAAFAALGLVAAADPSVVAPTTTPVNLATADGNPREFQGALDAERHQITAADLATFFAVSSPTSGYNLMEEGDVLAIWYDELVDSSGNYAGRRQSLPDNPETLGTSPRVNNTDVGNNLFLLRNHPERMPYAIPVAAVANQQLVFISNDRVTSGIPITLGQSAAPSSTTPDPVSLTAGAVGVSPYYARGDHVHLVPTTGTAPSAVTPSQSASAGGSSAVARSDHTHSTATAAAGAINPSASASAGSSSAIARADHIHSATRGTPISQGLDNANAAGGSNQFADAAHVHDIPSYSSAPNVVGATAGSAGTSAAGPARGDHTHQHDTMAGTDNVATDTTYWHGSAVAPASGTTGFPGFATPHDKAKVTQVPILGSYSESFDSDSFPPPFFSTIALPYSDSTLAWLPNGGSVGTTAMGWTSFSGQTFPVNNTNGVNFYLELDVYLPSPARLLLNYALLSSSGTLLVYASGPQNSYSTVGATTQIASLPVNTSVRPWYSPMLPAGKQTISICSAAVGTGTVPVIDSVGFWMPDSVDHIQRDVLTQFQIPVSAPVPPPWWGVAGTYLVDAYEPGSISVVTGDGIGSIGNQPYVELTATTGSSAGSIFFFCPTIPINLANAVVVEGWVKLASHTDATYSAGIALLPLVLGTPPTFTASQGIVFSGSSGNWNVAAFSGQSIGGSGFATDLNAHLLRLEVAPGGSNTSATINAYLDGVHVGNCTTSINHSTTPLFAGFYIASTTGTGTNGAFIGRLDVTNLVPMA